MFDTSSIDRDWKPGTTSVHGGEPRRKPYGSLTMPIMQTSTYTFENTAALREHMERKIEGLQPKRGEYGRYGNPNQEAVERKLMALEGGKDALVQASGMAALTVTLLTFLKSGDHYILTDDCYRRTRQLSLELMPNFAVNCTIVPLGDYEALEAAFLPETKLIITETPTNPYLRVIDLERLSEIARRHGVLTILDGTFGTPYNIRPLEWGVDLVIHSATKYLGGHNDLLAGVVVGDKELVERVRQLNYVLGAIASPHTLYLLSRGLKTLELRMARHNENGMKLARFLEGHELVERVWYPGLPSHPDHQIAARLMKGYGGVVSFTLKTDLDGTGRFIDALQIPYMGPSLGGVESIVEQPALMSHFTLSNKEREALGIPDGLVRYALGIENASDLIADVEQALRALSTSGCNGRSV